MILLQKPLYLNIENLHFTALLSEIILIVPFSLSFHTIRRLLVSAGTSLQETLNKAIFLRIFQVQFKGRETFLVLTSILRLRAHDISI